jgi:dynein heavy chain
VLIVGPTGTGKSVMIGQELRSQYNDEEYTHIQMAFSAQTTANQTQTIIDGKTFKLRKLNYCP